MGEKRKTPQNCRRPTSQLRFITTIKSVVEFTYIHITHKQNQKQSNQNKLHQIDPVNKGNQKLYLTKLKLTKAQTGKQN